MYALLQIAPDTTTFERIFGSSARIVAENAASVENMLPLTDNAVYKIFLFILFVGYCFVIMNHGGETGRMFKLLCNPNLSTRIADCYSRSYMAALRGFTSTGVVAMALAAVKTIEMGGVGSTVRFSPLWAVPIAAAALSIVFFIGSAVVDMVCKMTEKGDFGQGLLTIFLTFFSLFTLVATPLILLFALNATDLAAIICTIFATLATITVVGLALKTFIFFAEQKISILFWFLYLCAVIALPFGTLTTLIARAQIVR